MLILSMEEQYTKYNIARSTSPTGRNISEDEERREAKKKKIPKTKYRIITRSTRGIKPLYF